MMNTMGEVMKREYQMQYWLVVSGQEFFIYLFLKKMLTYIGESEEFRQSSENVSDVRIVGCS